MALSYSCRKDIYSDHNTLTFSSDTVLFDTVFSTIGSATHYLKVYNTSDQTMIISSVYLASGGNSQFYVNVDGEVGPMVKDVKLRKNDSLFIMIGVTVNPQNANSPMIVKDSLIFDVNGEQKDVDLVAWGQDAHYHTANAYGVILDQNNDSLRFYYHSVSCNETWTNDKPHVVYGYAIVDGPCELVIQEGAKVHFYKNSGIIVGNPFNGQSGASLKASGTASNPIYFKGSRLEQSYNNIPGQWDRIWFTIYSQDNSLSYTVIKNGNIAIQADSNVNGNPSVYIQNSIIQNHAGVGILGQGAYIKADNVVVANCGQYLCALIYGGKYDFTHCTLANFWDYGSRDKPSLFLNNYYEDANENIQVRDLDMANFTNCIVYGGLENELELDENTGGAFQALFNHCLLKTNINTSSPLRFSNILLNPENIIVDGASVDPIFKNASEADFSLREGSVAIDRGVVTPLNLDITEKPRDGSPDLGAFEY